MCSETEAGDPFGGAFFNVIVNDVTRHLFDAVRDKDAEQVLQLLSSSEDLSLTLDELNQEGHTCLGIACTSGAVEVVRLLLKFRADPNKSDFYGQPPLQYAAEYGHSAVVQLLIQNGADVNYIEERLSALHIAACKGRTEIVQLLMETKCDVNLRNKKGVTPLHCAVANGHRAVVELLLAAKAQTNVKGLTSDRTPLFMAAEIGDVEMVRMLLARGAKLNLADQFGMTPLILVCNRNNGEIAKVFIQAGAKVNVADRTGSIPLHYSSRSGDTDVVKMLLDCGSKVDVLNSNFESPLHLAIRMQYIEVVKLLVQYGCSTNICDRSTDFCVTPLFAAVTSYNDPVAFEEVLLTLMEGGCIIDLVSLSTSTSSSTTVSHETPMYRALDLGKADIGEVLLRHGADPYVDCPHDTTIMNKACQRRMSSFVELLMSSSYRWRRESWLITDFNPTCIASRNLGRFTDMPKGVPMIFWNKVALYNRILEVLDSPFSLQQWCRLVIRECIGGSRMFGRIKELHLPNKLMEFLLLRT